MVCSRKISEDFSLELLAHFVCDLGSELEYFDFMEFMTGKDMNPLRYARLRQKCLDELLRQLGTEELDDIVEIAAAMHDRPEDPSVMMDLQNWLDEQVSEYGLTAYVKPLPRVLVSRLDQRQRTRRTDHDSVSRRVAKSL